MNLTCPECGGTTFLRAMRRVSFALSWLPWLPPREVLVGYLARCEDCHTDVKIERNSIKRMRAVAPVAQKAPPREEKEDKPGIEPHRTPGMAWTREAR